MLAVKNSSPPVDLPRSQAGAQPQRLLVALLGDYWHGRGEHVPSSALVRLLADFDVTAVGARATLSRLARRGLLDSSRHGRNTYYGLTPRAAEAVRESTGRVLTFGRNQDPWDGSWTVAVFSVPEEQRDVRHSVRARLKWLGFAPLYDGVWVTPGLVGGGARRVFAEFGVAASTVFTTVEPGGGGPRPLIAAWDLRELRARYEEVVGEYTPLFARVRAGEVRGAEALRARAGVMDAWRRFPSLDPDLPLELLPDPWPREAAREVFAGVYDGLAPCAAGRVREVFAAVSPELAPLVCQHAAVP